MMNPRAVLQGNLEFIGLAEGAYIGSVTSFLREGNVGSASIYAAGQVQLGVIDSEQIARQYSNLSELFQKALVSIDSRMRSVTGLCAQLVLDSSVSGSVKP